MAEHRRVTLDRIYEAFETLIYEQGYGAVSLADIAKSIGLARTAMYNYFPDKESLLLAYAAREMDEYFSRLRLDLARTDDPFEALDVYVRSQVTYFATHHIPAGPALRTVLSAESFRSMRHHGMILEETLRAILDEAVAAEMIPAAVVDDPNLIRLVQSCLSSPYGRPVRGKELRELVASTQAFVRRALAAAATPALTAR